MDIIKIFDELNISYQTYNITKSDHIDIEYFNNVKDNNYLNNVIYIKEKDKTNNKDIPEDILIITNEVLKNKKTNYIVSKDNLNEIFLKLHSYFIHVHSKYHSINNFIKTVFSFNSSTVQQVVDQGVLLLGNPIIVTNAAYKVLGINANGIYVDDPTFDNAFKFGYCSAQSINWFEYEGITQKVLTNNQPVYLNTGMAEKIPRLISKIIVNNKVVAYVGVLEVQKKFSDTDFNNIELLSSVLQTAIGNDEDLLDSSNIIYETIINDIIKGKLNNELTLNERLKACHWKMKKYLRCSVITTSNKNKQIDNTNYIVNAISKELKLKAIIHDDMILIINEYDTHKKWHEQVEIIDKIIKDFDLKCGVSNEFLNPLGINKYYQEALNVIDIALELNVKDHIVYYAAFLPYILISNLDENIINNLENTYYQRLKSYDDTHNTEFCKTLYYYVLYNTNINDTSNKLCVHRNTLKYRLEKIIEITNIDITNGIMLQNFVLFYQIQYYLLNQKNSEK